MEAQHENKVSEIKQAAILFHDEISRKIDDLCNDPNFGYKEASHLSKISGRLDLFIEELKNFK